MAAFIGAPAAKGDPIDPVPTVAVNAPSTAMIGSSVSFDVSFVNGSATATGFGPFIDLTLPLGHDGDDGMTFASATYLGSPLAVDLRTADVNGDLTHPYAVDSSGDPVVIQHLQPYQTMVILRMPFGSFTPNQPAAVASTAVPTRATSVAYHSMWKPTSSLCSSTWVSTLAKTPPTEPASRPSTLNSTLKVRTILKRVAPSVFRTTASCMRRKHVLAMLDELVRSYGNENWEFDEHGLMRLRIASINDLPIRESDRKFHWPLGRRPDDHPGLSELGL